VKESLKLSKVFRPGSMEIYVFETRGRELRYRSQFGEYKVDDTIKVPDLPLVSRIR
jgi:hypothetical protein